MPLNMIKLCVGAESLDDLRNWGQNRLAAMEEAGEEVCLFHTTRMTPKRAAELLDGGSLYWVIKGNVQARQKLLELRPVVDTEGIRRCKLMLDSQIIATEWQPKRAFQGWRYLPTEATPKDLSLANETLPGHLKAELAELGLL
ncbi:MAG: DUF1489 family protein [Rhizobiaceae bacterium]